MALTHSDIKNITEFVKAEPKSIQEVSKLIGKSWVTTDSYIKQIGRQTGLVKVRTFRKGTQGALKVVYYNSSDSIDSDEVESRLLAQIRHGRSKQDFDFMELYQYVPDDGKRAVLEEYEGELAMPNYQIADLLMQASSQVYWFSGNMSFLNNPKDNHDIFGIIEECLKRKVRFKILCRVNMSSVKNLNQLSQLMKKYPDMIDIRHSYQPLRGFIVDDKVGRFKSEEIKQMYKEGELPRNTRIFFEVLDRKWVSWMQKVFWDLFRSSMPYESRMKELRKVGRWD